MRLTGMTLHHSQGMKVYSAAAPGGETDGAAPPGSRAALFRPDFHARRLNASAARLALPAVDEATLVADISRLAAAERDAGWLPAAPGAALYIRPLLMAAEPSIGVRRSDEALLVVSCHPVGSYFGGGAGPPASLRLRVDPDGRARAWPGGVGACKTGGSYGASIAPAEDAAAAGFDQVLWTGGDADRTVGECGQMNVFWVERSAGDGAPRTLVTPELDGTILAGATRDTVLKIAVAAGVAERVAERRVPLAELTAGMAAGSVVEMFGTGTGAIIVPVRSVSVDGREFVAKEREERGDASATLRRALLDIYHQREPSPWMLDIDAAAGRGDDE
jgi:branched-chain amino acid aminotransferase